MNKKILVLSLLSLPFVFGLASCKEKKTSHIVDDVVFEDNVVISNGSEQELVASNVPDGYTCEYLNNKGIEQGRYNATCKVFDQNKELKRTINAVLTIDNPKNEEFEGLLNDIFVESLGNNPINWNVFTIDSQKYGYEYSEGSAKWYTYTSYNQNEIDNTITYYNELKNELEKYKDEKLSYEELYTYQGLYEEAVSNLEYYEGKTPNDLLISLNYIDSSGGYVSEFAQSMQGYHVRNKQDALNIVSFVSSTKDSFQSYATYANERLSAGYPLTDTTLNGMIDYLDDITKQGDNYYLKSAIDVLIESCSDISNGDATQIKSDLSEAFENSFFPAVKSLSAGLKPLVGSSTNKGYYSYYQTKGKDEYRHDLADLLGVRYSKIDDEYIQNYINDIESGIKEYMSQINGAYLSARNFGGATYNYFLRYISGESLVGITDIEEILKYLKEFSKTIVEPLENEPEISISEMDKTVQDITNTVAYYTKSALDSNGKEYVTLNPKYINDDANNTLVTLAHEGYPGHLYSYCLLKENKDLSNLQIISSNKFFAEGWAVYVELALYDYIRNNHLKSGSIRYACDYLKYEILLNYLLYTRLDIGINYEGWSISEVSNYLANNGFNQDGASELYETLVEIPTVYAAYGYGSYYFYKLHNEAKSELGTHYNEISYNKYILSHGWVSIEVFDKLHKEFIETEKFKYSL